MRFKDLYLCCCNLNKYSNMTVLEEGKKTVKAKLEDIYDEICDRQIIWFSVENGNMILIKLEEDWTHNITKVFCNLQRSESI